MDATYNNGRDWTLDTLTKHNQLLATPAVPQTQSPLFRIPLEIRRRIFEYALTDYRNPDFDWKRQDPELSFAGLLKASKRVDTQLLRTCRAAYEECWFMPLTLLEHVYQDAEQDDPFAPYFPVENSSSWLARWAMLELIANHQSQSRGRTIPEIEIAYMHVLTTSDELVHGYLLKFFRAQRPVVPRVFHITLLGSPFQSLEHFLRHDEWLRAVSLPNFVREVHFEMLRHVTEEARKEEDFRGFMDEIRDSWFFSRSDGVVLYGDKDTWVESNWSTCLGPEPNTSSRDHVMTLFITITFRTEESIIRRGGLVSERAKENARRRGESYGYGPNWLPGPIEEERCCVQ
jgi:hypothetical protein